jgi:hypothetical protein
VVSDIDIWRAAYLLIDRHGAEAMTEAAEMIDKMLDGGDLDGRAVWLRIRHAIIELQAQPAGPAH